MTNSSLAGILPALVTPLREDGEVEAASIEKLLARVYGAGAHGVYVCGSTGEGLALPDSARKQVAEIAAKHSPPGKQVVVHVGAKTMESTLALARHASELGATAISSLPLAGIGAAELPGFYERIAQASAVPVVAYYFPGFSGYELSLEELAAVATTPGVAGVKFTDYNLYVMSLLAEQGVRIFNGRDEVLAAGLLMGAAGGIGSIYNLIPKAFVAVFDLAKSSRWDEAKKLQLRINQFIAILLGFPLLPALKQVLIWCGIPCGRTMTQPTHLTNEQQDELQRALEPFEDLLAER